MTKKVILMEQYKNRFYDDIKSLYLIAHEKEGYEQLLSFLINNNMKNSADYIDLWADYLLLIIKWGKEIKQFENNVVYFFIDQGMTLSTWNYEFEEEELTIYEV